MLGSNVFNILGILGVSAIAASMVTWTDMGAIFLALVLLFIFAFTGRRLARWEGGVLLTAYFLYIGMRFDLIPTFGG